MPYRLPARLAAYTFWGVSVAVAFAVAGCDSVSVAVAVVDTFRMLPDAPRSSQKLAEASRARGSQKLQEIPEVPRGL